MSGLKSPFPRLHIGRVLLPGILGLLGFGCAGGPPPPAVEPDIEPPALIEIPDVRVGVLVHVEDAQIGATGAYTLADDDGVLVVGSAPEVFSVRREGSGILVYTTAGDLVDSVEGILIVEPRDENDQVTVNGARYPSSLQVVISPTGGMNVINTLDVETYLRGVVPLEIGHQDPALLEAAKAQAVAARTYVAGHMNQYPSEGFDLFAGVADQVYGPVDRRHPNADRAIWETRGVILTYNGSPIVANYASTCGGKTAGAEESFASEAVPYLKSHSDNVDGRIACRTSRVYRWEESWSGDQLLDTLRRTIPRVLNRPFRGTRIRNLQAVEKGKSGRIVVLRVVTDLETYDIEKGQIRQVLESTGGRPLRSTAFEPQIWKSGNRIRMVVAQGRGWGHGVGMCQWGAMQLSRDGYGYKRILKHYYPGTRLKAWFPPQTLSMHRVMETENG